MLAADEPENDAAGGLSWLAPSPNPAARRVVMAGLAGVLLTAPLSIEQLIPLTPVVGNMVTAAGAALAIRCCLRRWRPSGAATWAAAVVCVVFAAVTLAEGAGQAVTALRSTDHQLLCVDDASPAIVGGGQAMLHGPNPYTSYNVLKVEQSLGCASFHVTPLRGGVFAGRSTPPPGSALEQLARASLNVRTSNDILLGFYYPAGSGLIGLAGAHGVVVLDVLLLLVAGAAVVGRAPPPARRSLGLALAAQSGVLVFVGEAHPDGIVAALLIVACARREPLLSGISAGLACAIKQTAWFIAPALLVLAFRRGRSAGLRQAAATGVAFAVVNLPSIAADPIAWLRGVLAPQRTLAFPLGVGPVDLFAGAGHVAAVVAIFTVLSGLTVVGGWIVAAFGRHGWAEAGVIVSSLALWDGARSLGNYLGLLGVLAVSICARNLVPISAPADRPQAAERVANGARLRVSPWGETLACAGSRFWWRPPSSVWLRARRGLRPSGEVPAWLRAWQRQPSGRVHAWTAKARLPWASAAEFPWPRAEC